MTRFNTIAVAASAAWLGVSSIPALGAEGPVQHKPAHLKPAIVETTTGAVGTVKTVRLTPKAAERLGIELDEVRVDPSGRRIIPYSAVLYDLTGKTWVYVQGDPMSFARAAVNVEIIKGENVYLKDGPAPGTKVLVTGVQQVYGTEVGIGH
jgi:hypothetical protein